MIALVTPVKRLPRGLDSFSYVVPHELTSHIQPGQLVQIPFRGTPILGIVEQVDTSHGTSETKLKSLLSIAQKEPIFSTADRVFLQTCSEWYGVSSGAMQKIALPPFSKKRLQNLSFTKKPQQKPSLFPNILHTLYHNEIEHASALCAHVEKGQILILVPEQGYIDEIKALLPANKQTDIIEWHSQLTMKQQTDRWLQVRNNEKSIIIGTRSAVFLTFHNLRTIIIDYEQDENHKHWDQYPRWHTKDVASFLASLQSTKLVLMSFSPSCESYFHIRKGQWKGAWKLKALENIHIVDMTEERRASHFGLFARSVTETILQTEGDILFFVQRRGSATSVGCRDCGHIETCKACKNILVFHESTNSLHCHYCQTQFSFSGQCPHCQCVLMALRGAGTELVETEIRRLYEKKETHDIIRFDGESKDFRPGERGSRILIGTEAMFPHVRWYKTDTIIFLSLDQLLALPEYSAEERVWHLIAKMNYRRKKNANILIQSHTPNHLIFRSLKEPDRFYRSNLQARKVFDYPPYRFLVRYLFCHEVEANARQEAERLYTHLENTLTTEEKKSILIIRPVALHPTYYRGKHWYTLSAKLSWQHWSNSLILLNTHIPKSWKIDPRPLHILSH